MVNLNERHLNENTSLEKIERPLNIICIIILNLHF